MWIPFETQPVSTAADTIHKAAILNPSDKPVKDVRYDPNGDGHFISIHRNSYNVHYRGTEVELTFGSVKVKGEVAL